LLSESKMERLRKSLREAFHKEVVGKGGWELTDQPGPDVLIARGALIDLIVRVPPQTAGRSTVYLDSFGEATLVIELYDSQSREILARIADRDAAEPPGNRMGTDMEAPGEVRRMFSAWAKRFRETDEARRETLRSGPLGTAAALFGLIFVIFVPWIPRPAISPFWPKMNAYTPFFAVVVVIVLPMPSSTMTMLGPTPISQPSLLSR
jgi:hypothetical protein